MLKWYYPRTSSGRPVSFVHWHITFYKSIMVWPTENHKTLFTVGLAFMIFLYVHTGSMELFRLLENSNEVLCAIDSICNFATEVNGLTRIIYVFLNHEELKTVFDMLYEHVYIPR